MPQFTMWLTHLPMEDESILGYIRSSPVIHSTSGKGKNQLLWFSATLSILNNHLTCPQIKTLHYSWHRDISADLLPTPHHQSLLFPSHPQEPEVGDYSIVHARAPNGTVFWAAWLYCPEISLGGGQMHHQEAYQSLLKLHIQKVQSPAFYFLNISPSLFFLSLITPNVSLRLLKKSSNWTLVSSLALILLTVHRKVCEGIQNVDWIM